MSSAVTQQCCIVQKANTAVGKYTVCKSAICWQEDVALKASPVAALHMHRRVLGVIGILHCPTARDFDKAVAQFETMCRSVRMSCATTDCCACAVCQSKGGVFAYLPLCPVPIVTRQAVTAVELTPCRQLFCFQEAYGSYTPVALSDMHNQRRAAGVLFGSNSSCSSLMFARYCSCRIIAQGCSTIQLLQLRSR